VFNGINFHEAVYRVNVPLDDVLGSLAAEGIIAGVPLAEDYPELENCFSLCCTETKSEDDIKIFVDSLSDTLMRLQAADNSAQPKTA